MPADSKPIRNNLQKSGKKMVLTTFSSALISELDIVLLGLFYSGSVLGVLASVISAYYYLRIIKVIYFDDLKQNLNLHFSISLESKIILFLLMLIISLFVFYPSFLINFAASLEIK